MSYFSASTIARLLCGTGILHHKLLNSESIINCEDEPLAGDTKMNRVSNIFPKDEERPTAIVVGAGLAGVTAAYELAQKGYAVAVIEAFPDLSTQCTSKSGGLVSHLDVEPTFWGDALRNFGTPFAFRRYRLEWFPTFNTKIMIWFDDVFYKFSRRTIRYWKYTFKDLRLKFINIMSDFSELSMDYTREMITNAGLEHNIHANGILQLYHHEKEFEINKEIIEKKIKNRKYSNESIDIDISGENAYKLCPWLLKREFFKSIVESKKIIGSIFIKDNYIVNSENLTSELANICHEKYGVRFFTGVRVVGFQQRLCRWSNKSATDDALEYLTAMNVDTDWNIKRRKAEPKWRKKTVEISGVFTSSGFITLPHKCAVILSCGVYCCPLSRGLGIYIPIYPVKGYNIDVDIHSKDLEYIRESSRLGSADSESSKMIIDLLEGDVNCLVDKAAQVYISRIGKNKLRMTGVRELSSWEAAPTFNTAELFKAKVLQMVPQLERYIRGGSVYMGMRPVTPDGLPYTGRIRPYQNLYIHAGHGGEGNKTAPLTAKILANDVAGTVSELADEYSKKDTNAAISLMESILAFTPQRNGPGGVWGSARNFREWLAFFVASTVERIQKPEI
eukprot:GHVL01034010.1.p1 GENE.GHVL01034010.1~~GHVL01034010.1.p1  ORF type:complete len:618 (-),score=147.55 GHVL01034010.1:6-1859(-)